MSKYGDTMYRRSERVNTRIKETYSHARHFKLPHADIVTKLTEIRKSDDYRKLSQYYRGYAEGILRSEGDRMYDILEWRLSLDGKLYKSQDVPNGRWKDIDSSKSAHVYREDPTKLY